MHAQHLTGMHVQQGIWSSGHLHDFLRSVVIMRDHDCAGAAPPLSAPELSTREPDVCNNEK